MLHKIGLASILISSKLEDIIPIYMKEIVTDAGHEKFTKDDILETERIILQTLEFKVLTETLIE